MVRCDIELPAMYMKPATPEQGRAHACRHCGVDDVEQLSCLLGGQHQRLAAPDNVLRPAYRMAIPKYPDMAQKGWIEWDNNSLFVKLTETGFSAV
jgi:hypothetical protein